MSIILGYVNLIEMGGECLIGRLFVGVVEE